jgi:hypothetical protein
MWQILALEVSFLVRPELFSNVPESEKDRLLVERGCSIYESEMVVEGHEDNLGVPLHTMHEDVEHEGAGGSQRRK